MKKILFLVAFFSFASVASMNAQITKIQKNSQAVALKVANEDPSILVKEGDNGQVSFSKKSVCSKSGKVSYSRVQYNEETKSWDTVAKSRGSRGAKSCGSKGKKGKSCCSGSKGKKSCGSKGAKSCGSKKKS